MPPEIEVVVLFFVEIIERITVLLPLKVILQLVTKTMPVMLRFSGTTIGFDVLVAVQPVTL